MQKYNLKDLEKCYFGTTEIEQIMYGNKEIWGGNRIIALGTNTSFNVSSYYSKYKDLTADNFFFVSQSPSSITGTSTAVVHATGNTTYITIWVGMTKTYTASTGQLSFYQFDNYNTNHTTGSGDTTETKYGKLKTVLVTKPEKLTYLGLGNTFNIKNLFPNDYQNFTANNFIAKYWNYRNGGTQGYLLHSSANYEGSWDGTGTMTLVKNYNASTGILQFYYADAWTLPNSSGNGISNLYVYFTKKAVE